jgi:hypothetical protein
MLVHSRKVSPSSFLGFMRYFGRFIPRFSGMPRHLYDLTRMIRHHGLTIVLEHRRILLYVYLVPLLCTIQISRCHCISTSMPQSGALEERLCRNAKGLCILPPSVHADFAQPKSIIRRRSRSLLLCFFVFNPGVVVSKDCKNRSHGSRTSWVVLAAGNTM